MSIVPRTTPDQGRAAALTEQQHRAVLTRAVSVVLSSGAGCGKTHVLTERYLSHLRDDGAEVGQIVAITFTDRAAREMRGRIRRAVAEHLRAARGAEAEAWTRHLRGLETAPISTIHAFCAALLRQHAVEAGLDPRFDVLEEVLAVNLESEALALCLQRLLTAQTPAGEDLRQLVLLYGWRTVGEAVAHLLHAHDPGRWAEWLARPADEVVQEWQRYARAELLPRYIEHILTARPALARCLTLLRRFPPLPGPMADNVARLFEGLPRLARAPDLGAAVDELIEAAKVGRVGSKAWPDPAVYEPIKDALQHFRDALRNQHLECFDAAPEALAESAAVGRRFLRVAAEVFQAYQVRKRTHGVVDFQDLLLRARDLLRDHAEVRARLCERYRFLLIDELQDTDPVQMELIEYLCGGRLIAGKLFAVGDHKQSIYRFRGAEVSLFQGLRERVAHEGRQGLTVNFRSQPAVLDFVNALLGHCLPHYEPLRAHHDQVNPGACVEFLWAPRPAKSNVYEARAIEAEWIARRIAGMVEREALVVDRSGPVSDLRPVRPGDVVLLFRAMSNVHLYEAALRRHGLNYYLVGGRAFFAQQEIYDLLNLLRALENPQDAVSLAGTLRAPFCCVSDEALFVLGRHRDGLWAGLLDESADNALPADQRERVDRARRHLQRWRGLKDRLPIARLLSAVFADSGYDAATQFEFLADRKLANLWKLLDLARTFDRSGLFGLAEFIDRLGDLVRTQPREEQAATQPENADVVRLMTIHQAKGLEFPVVLVPDVAAVGGGSAQPVAVWDTGLGCVVRPPADEEEPPFADFAWRLREARGSLEDWAEDLRTLYVACTRARDYLILSGALPEDFEPGNAWMLTLAERFDLATGQCLAAEVPEAERPRLRVHDRLRPPAAPPAPAVVDPAPVVLPSFPPPGPVVAPSTARLISVEELEALMKGKETLFAGMVDQELGEGAVRPQGAVERVLRAILRAWDFREPEGWRPLLEQHMLPDMAGSATRELHAMLERFAGSALRHQLAEATICQRDVEFLLNLPGSCGESRSVRGVIDCLWRDAAGRWHLVFYTLASVSAAGRVQQWRREECRLVLAVEALRGQTGQGPGSVTLHFLRDGGSIRRAGGRLPVRSVLARVLEAIKERGPGFGLW